MFTLTVKMEYKGDKTFVECLRDLLDEIDLPEGSQELSGFELDPESNSLTRFENVIYAKEAVMPQAMKAVYAWETAHPGYYVRAILVDEQDEEPPAAPAPVPLELERVPVATQ